jgi:hypothetical protein
LPDNTHPAANNQIEYKHQERFLDSLS